MGRNLRRVKLRSEQISLRLFVCMAIIILSILYISIPLILNSFQEYNKTNQVLSEITSLRALVQTANKISRERGPANKVMSSTSEEIVKNKQELAEFRLVVDEQINETVSILNQAGFNSVATQLQTNLKVKLEHARKIVDAYAEIPQSQRTSPQLDHAILTMFSVWDNSRELLNELMAQSKSKDSKMSNYFISILILTDMRDQAGRVASNVMAPITFSEKISDINRARTLQTEHQARYLWSLVDVIQPQYMKTSDYIRLHQRVRTEFLEQGLPIIRRLLDESQNNQTYFLTGTQLTEQIVDKYTTVIDLQKYILDYSVLIATQQNKNAKQQYFFTLSISSLSLLIALFTMIYTKRKVFSPLIKAREMILGLSDTMHEPPSRQKSKHEFYTLFEAINKLKVMLKQRDLMESQLKQIANTDTLTGVSNRLALEEYINDLTAKPNALSQTCVFAIDIDHFKFVNDQYGHLVGDEVIAMVAEQLKQNVRASDLIVRYGGDEFLVVIESIQMEAAKAIAESIRLGIATQNIVVTSLGKAIQVSVSIGVAIGAESWLELLEKADQSLLKAKARGKNVVV
ncbi:GGDEF domain-containing protein [Acinetobacter sp. NIPH 1852]|uniref:GGDEF domain-containing protein n=1 Tax=Acinetobacter sp. NIPH 1852 TaxID=2923428 RepID=UPI001F4B662A|nr:GGDEF domain-containing protein [Acinetobacter sp. NIPH 1852]MCH7308115.1 GGDEF domain-containing protein [Acinetobacter sp. NIPH 1852]